SMCTGTMEQYTMLAVCQAACPAFPVGTASDNTGDTLGCRYHHLLTGDACATAGPSGGTVCGTDPCVPYCDLMLTACTGADSAYASRSACMTACTSFAAPSGQYSTAATGATDGDVY